MRHYQKYLCFIKMKQQQPGVGQDASSTMTSPMDRSERSTVAAMRNKMLTRLFFNWRLIQYNFGRVFATFVIPGMMWTERLYNNRLAE